MLALTQPLAELIARQDTTGFARRAGDDMAGKALVDRGVELAVQGRITISEVMRIGQVEE